MPQCTLAVTILSVGLLLFCQAGAQNRLECPCGMIEDVPSHGIGGK